jgi:hypothetical protein
MLKISFYDGYLPNEKYGMRHCKLFMFNKKYIFNGPNNFFRSVNMIILSVKLARIYV